MGWPTFCAIFPQTHLVTLDAILLSKAALKMFSSQMSETHVEPTGKITFKCQFPSTER
jgi:hypothetical protein